MASSLGLVEVVCVREPEVSRWVPLEVPTRVSLVAVCPVGVV